MFLIDNQKNNRPIVRHELHKALGVERLVEDFEKGEDIEIVGSDEDGKLKSVTIIDTELPQLKKIWRINLELDIQGIKPQSKTTEAAILALTHIEGHATHILNVILLELKSSLRSKKPNFFKDIEDKFRASMSRLYLLLALNQYHSPKQGYQNMTIKVIFKGAVCYNGNIRSNESSDLRSILESEKQKGLLTLVTILKQQDKIEVKGFQNPDYAENPENFEIPLQKLLNI